jgi:hypothetical protein
MRAGFSDLLGGKRARWLSPERVLHGFIASNLAFLALDIALAHAANRFARREEWWPIAFSGCAAVLLVPSVLRPERPAVLRRIELLVGAVSVAVGVLGMILHLQSAFFETQTLATLVYSAPFAAPLAYVGLGLLVIMTRLELSETEIWEAWVLLFTLGGFVGNLALTLTDHAQNGFFSVSEWAAVVGAAFGCSFLAVLLMRPESRALERAVRYVLALEATLGVLGFALHVRSNLGRPGSWFDRALYGAPLFAPLLFTDLAVLGAIALWSRARRAGA